MTNFRRKLRKVHRDAIRRVASPEGVRRFGLPEGSPIKARPREPKAPRAPRAAPKQSSAAAGALATASNPVKKVSAKKVLKPAAKKAPAKKLPAKKAAQSLSKLNAKLWDDIDAKMAMTDDLATIGPEVGEMIDAHVKAHPAVGSRDAVVAKLKTIARNQGDDAWAESMDDIAKHFTKAAHPDFVWDDEGLTGKDKWSPKAWIGGKAVFSKFWGQLAGFAHGDSELVEFLRDDADKLANLYGLTREQGIDLLLDHAAEHGDQHTLNRMTELAKKIKAPADEPKGQTVAEIMALLNEPNVVVATPDLAKIATPETAAGLSTVHFDDAAAGANWQTLPDIGREHVPYLPPDYDTPKSIHVDETGNDVNYVHAKAKVPGKPDADYVKAYGQSSWDDAPTLYQVVKTTLHADNSVGPGHTLKAVEAQISSFADDHSLTVKQTRKMLADFAAESGDASLTGQLHFATVQGREAFDHPKTEKGHQLAAEKAKKAAATAGSQAEAAAEAGPMQPPASLDMDFGHVGAKVDKDIAKFYNAWWGLKPDQMDPDEIKQMFAQVSMLADEHNESASAMAGRIFNHAGAEENDPEFQRDFAKAVGALGDNPSFADFANAIKAQSKPKAPPADKTSGWTDAENSAADSIYGFYADDIGDADPEELQDLIASKAKKLNITQNSMAQAIYSLAADDENGEFQDELIAKLKAAPQPHEFNSIIVGHDQVPDFGSSGDTGWPGDISPQYSRELTALLGSAIGDLNAEPGSAANPRIFTSTTWYSEGRAYGASFTEQDHDKWRHVELRAIRNYTSSSYDLNRDLRAGQFPSDAEHLDDAFVSAQAKPMPQWTLLTRGTDLAELGLDDNASLSTVRSLIGQRFTNDAYTSTSMTTDPAMGGAVRIIFRCPPGTRGLYVDGDGTNQLTTVSREKEVILHRKTEYRVVSVQEGQGTGARYDVVVEIVGQHV